MHLLTSHTTPACLQLPCLLSDTANDFFGLKASITLHLSSRIKGDAYCPQRIQVLRALADPADLCIGSNRNAYLTSRQPKHGIHKPQLRVPGRTQLLS